MAWDIAAAILGGSLPLRWTAPDGCPSHAEVAKLIDPDAAMRARGIAVAGAQTRNVVWAAALACAGVTVAPQRWWALSLRASLVVALVRHEFVLGSGDDDLRVLKSNAVGGRAVLGFEVHLP